MDTIESPAKDELPDVWVEIPGYSRYQFNPKTGALRSKDREHKFGPSTRKVKGQQLKFNFRLNGNHRYNIRCDGYLYRQTSVSISKLMILTGYAKEESIDELESVVDCSSETTP